MTATFLVKVMTRREATQVLKLCDKLDFGQLMDLGAYLIACAFHKCKPTIGTNHKNNDCNIPS